MGNTKIILNELKIDRKNPYPLYRQLADQLRKIIDRGELSENFPLPPERDLSRELQINHLTVRKALGILENDNIIYKIRGKGRFVRNRAEMSDNLRAETAGRVIGIFSPETLEDSNLGIIIQGAVDSLHRKAFRVLRIPAHDREDELNRLNTNCQLLSGIIFCNQHTGKDRLISINLTRAKNLPTVVVDQNDLLENIDQVTYDEKQGIRDALQFLYDNGHRKIAYFGGITDPERPHPRKTAYLEYINNLSLPDCLVEYPITPEKNHTVSAREMTSQRLQKGTLPKAIMANNDASAIGIYSAIQEAGLTIGQDIELIGFGNTFEDSPFLLAQNYPISTVGILKRKLGAKAVALLLKRISQPCLPPQKAILPTKLVHRGSTRFKK